MQYVRQCQSAALDELFGKPGVCFPRYQTAQILFHSLAQQTDHPQDKSILGKCKRTSKRLLFDATILTQNNFMYSDKEAVEKRLFVLQKQGHNIYTKTNDFFT